MRSVALVLLLITAWTLMPKAFAQAGSPPASTSPGNSIPVMLLTPAQAVQVARDFCDATQEPVSGEPDKTEALPSYDLFLGRCWAIHFPAQVYIVVSDNTGKVIYYSDERKSNALSHVPSGDAISESEARIKVGQVLQAAGFIGTGSISEPRLVLTDPDTHTKSLDGGNTFVGVASGHVWMIDCARRFNGIECDEGQSVGIELQAETGSLNSMIVRFNIEPPSDTMVRVTQQQAVDAAWNAIAATTVPNPILESVALKIRRPNDFDFTRGNGGRNSTPGPARVLYECTFRYQAQGGDISNRIPVPGEPLLLTWPDPYNIGTIDLSVTLMVDAGTGTPTIMGGYTTAPTFGLNRWGGLGALIALAREVRVYGRDIHRLGGWNFDKPLLVWSERSQPASFHVAKGATAWPVLPDAPVSKKQTISRTNTKKGGDGRKIPERHMVLLLVQVIRKDDRSMNPYGYDLLYTDSGLLGTPNAWLVPPPSLRAALNVVCPVKTYSPNRKTQKPTVKN